MGKVLITGVAGFIGSHLMSHFLGLGESVVGLDNFLTGKEENLAAVLSEDAGYAGRFEMWREDVRDYGAVKRAMRGVDCVYHEAALGSVPWSIEDPGLAHGTNLTGFVNILEAARSCGVRRVVYASSSAVVGDARGIPAREGEEGHVLSPYAASKRAQEVYAEAWARCYGLEIVGLRYFNVFGARQDPNGAYAAVIPRWLAAMRRGEACVVYGDGQATRDYCHVSNVVRANDLSGHVDFGGHGCALALNIGCGAETSLLELHELMRKHVESKYGVRVPSPNFMPARLGDIARSVADISGAREAIGYAPQVSLAEGLSQYVCEGA